MYWDETNGWVADSFDVIPHGVDGISADKFDLAERLLSYKTDASFSNDTGTELAVISELAAHYDIHNFESVNSQMAAQSGWITLTFSEQPDDTAMWKMASVFLALYEDIEEFRWEFVGANDTLYTYYVTRDDVAKILKRDDVTEYAVSDDHLSGMMMLLDENATGVTKSTNDMEQKINKHLSYSIFHHYTDKAGVPRDVADYYERRLMEDDVIYRNDENKAIYECIYKDFDHSGEMDMALYIRDLGYGESTLHIYMNDDPLYTHVLPMSCLSMEILSGDIDHDGHMELVYSAHNGGTGGAGGYVKGILKYRNHTFTEMSLPGEFLEEETSQGDNGYNIDVYWGNEENSYIITCESLGIREQIYSEYLKDEDGSYVIPSKQGQLVGANCRGFYTLYVINENGKDYLMAEEYFHGEAGVNHGLGYMRFIFDWEKSDGWIVKECEIVPYNPILTDERGYFVGMKKDIKYYPSDYETIIKNWTIPVIDHNGEIMFERNNRFSVFAQDASNNASSFDFVFARLNEKDEITYVYICYEDGVYYYLEDYTRLSEKPGNADSEGYSTAIYTNEVYDATMYSSGECYEHFYLTNEENLTHDDIMKAMLSSQYPPQIDVTTVYSKKLDEKGLNSYMNATGDFITYGIDINLPKNRSWISSPNYKDMGNSLIRANYYDMILSADMVLRAGPRKIVFEKARAGLEDDLSEWDYETWSAWTADDEYVEIKLYVEQLGGTNFNTVVAEWEYEGNTYLLYGDTQETDGSPVAKTAAFIIEQFKK